MTKRMIIMMAIAAVVFGGVFFMSHNMSVGMADYLEHMPSPAAAISTTKVSTMTWDNTVDAAATLVAAQSTTVTTEAGGIVQAIHFESGAHVQQGALLVTLDSANEQAELKRLQAQAELARLNHARREKLYGLEAISKSDLDSAESEAAAAQAAVDAQQAKLAQKQIRAPFAGQLGIRQVNVGQFLDAGKPIVTLQALDPVYADFNLPEQQLGVVTAGLAVEAEVAAWPGKKFGGKVVAVEPRVDEATRNFHVRAQMDNGEGKLAGGQSAHITLKLPGARTLVVVPHTAISYSSYGSSVFVVGKMAHPADKDAPRMPQAGPWTDLEVTQRFVKTGEERGDFVAVTDGLKVGEEIATSGLLKLRNQQPVLINNDAPPKPELNPSVPQG
ncbi:MAG TPA: efflux RND transporter periplasmic adaptor subunit [Nevskiaceae bacterium]|nr:efflux RND transporter periplasmic adaptor subunit [Nevskiaceae bacterium]